MEDPKQPPEGPGPESTLEFWAKDEGHLAIVGRTEALRGMGFKAGHCKEGEFNLSRVGDKMVLTICSSQPRRRMQSLKAGHAPMPEWFD